MVNHKVVITNPTGLHLRAAGVLCTEAVKFKSKITFSRDRRLVKRVLAGLLLVCLITAGILFLYFPLVRKDFRFLPFLRPENKAEPAVMEALEDPENALCFIFVNVGEGDCTIVYEPKTQSALIIDAGYWNYATHVTEQVKRFGEVR